VPRISWLPIALVIAACGAETGLPESATSVDSAGIRVVTNSLHMGEVPSRAIQPSPILEIRSDPQGERVLYQVTAVTPLPNGNIAVGTDGSKQIHVFGQDDSYLYSFGRSGDGPGEFSRIESVVPFPGDSIAVYDPRKKVLAVFDGSGMLGRTLSLTELAPAQAWSKVLPIQGDFILLGFSGLGGQAREGVFRNTEASFRFDREGSVLTDYGEFPGVEAFAGERMIGARIFGASLSAATSHDRLVIGVGEGPELTYFDEDGELAQIVRWPDHDREVTPAVVSRFIEKNLAEVPEPQRPAARRQMESLPFAPTQPAYQDLLTGQDGEVWVGNYPFPEPAFLDSPGPSRTWTVIGPEGDLRYRVETPVGFRVSAVYESRVYGVFVDEMGVESVRVYALSDS
jgi:hypothetical protein